MVYDLHDLGSWPLCFEGTVRRRYRDSHYPYVQYVCTCMVGWKWVSSWVMSSDFILTRHVPGWARVSWPGPGLCLLSCVWAAQDVPLCRPMGTTGTLAWPAPPGAPGQSGPWTPLQAQVRWHITRKVPSNELEDYRLKWSMQMINLIFNFMNGC